MALFGLQYFIHLHIMLITNIRIVYSCVTHLSLIYFLGEYLACKNSCENVQISYYKFSLYKYFL